MNATSMPHHCSSMVRLLQQIVHSARSAALLEELDRVEKEIVRKRKELELENKSGRR